MRQHHVQLAFMTVVGVFLMGAGCPQKIEPPEPSVASDYAQLLKPRRSRLDISFSGRITPLLDFVNSSFPRSFAVAPYNHGIDGGPDFPACGAGIGYEFNRGDLGWAVPAANTLQADLGFSYWIKARKRIPCPGPLLSFSCGTNGEPARRGGSGFQSALSVDNSFNLVARTSSTGVSMTDQCMLGLWGVFNATPLVTSVIESRLGALLSDMDTKIQTSTNFRGRMVDAWTALQRPRQLAPSLWLTLFPKEVTMAQPRFSKSGGDVFIEARLRLVAEPVLELGPQPNVQPTSLPAATNDDGIGNSFDINLPVSLPYAQVTKELKERLRIAEGDLRYPPIGDTHVVVTDIDVRGYGSKAVVKVSFAGSAKGWAYFIGRPVYDAGSRTLSFPDLEYSTESKNLLLKLLDWWEHEKIRDDLRGRLKVTMGDALDQQRQRLSAALNTEENGLVTQGSVDTLLLLGVMSDTQSQTFRGLFHANGQLNLLMK